MGVRSSLTAAKAFYSPVSMQTLAHLLLSGNSITSKGAVPLFAGCAKNNTSLATVAVDHNDLREEGLRAVLKCLGMNAGIVYVRLDNTNGPDSLRIAAEILLEARRER
jgi:hypothetical protein